LRALARAAVQVPALQALVVGDGPLRSEAEAEAQRLGLTGRVVFLGVRKDVPELLSGLDAVLFSSVREGFSLTMLEAMAAGVPVIATEVGGTPELITHGRTGLLVPPGQPEQLAEALVGLLLDPAGAAAIQEAARKSVEERFSLSSMVEAHAQIYEGHPALDSEGRRP
jgi:glycosyltransferase involved in cell wall biosynthesis